MDPYVLPLLENLRVMDVLGRRLPGNSGFQVGSKLVECVGKVRRILGDDAGLRNSLGRWGSLLKKRAAGL